jgi:hypothetical protein
MVHIVRNEHELEAGRQGKTGKGVGMSYTELYSTRAYPTQARKQHSAGQQKGLMSSLGGVEGYSYRDVLLRKLQQSILHEYSAGALHLPSCPLHRQSNKTHTHSQVDQWGGEGLGKREMLQSSNPSVCRFTLF